MFSSEHHNNQNYFTQIKMSPGIAPPKGGGDGGTPDKGGGSDGPLGGGGTPGVSNPANGDGGDGPACASRLGISFSCDVD